MTLTAAKHLQAAARAHAVTPPAYGAAAKTKLERDRKSFEAFRAVDQAEHDRAHERRVTEAVATAEDDVRLWRQDVGELEPQAEARWPRSGLRRIGTGRPPRPPGWIGWRTRTPRGKSRRRKSETC